MRRQAVALLYAFLVAAAHASQPALSLVAVDVNSSTVCRQVKDGATSSALVSLDSGLASGPSVSSGQELRYAGLKLVDSAAGTAWAVVYAEDGALWKFPAADMAYCSLPGCPAKAGSQFATERGSSCELDTDCCEGLVCADTGRWNVTLRDAAVSQRTFTTGDALALLPKQCTEQAAAGTGSTLLLKEGEWPVTAGQSACMARAAEGSPEFTNFFGMAQLLGTAMFYGPSNETDAVLETVGIADLLPLSVGEATRSFEAWAKQTLRVCSLAEPQLEGQAADDAGAMAAWFNSISEQAVWEAARGNSTAALEASLAGRRLLWSLRNMFGLDMNDEAAVGSSMALGTVAGFASGLASAFVAATVVATLPVSAGIIGSIAVGATVAYFSQKWIDDGVKDLYDTFETDGSLELAFEQGQALGGLASSVYQPAKGFPALQSAWRTAANNIRNANLRVVQAQQALDDMIAAGSHSAEEIEKARRSLRAYKGWATRRAQQQRQLSGKTIGGVIKKEDAVGLGISAAQMAESFEKLDRLNSADRSTCSYTEHVLCTALPGGSTQLETVDGVISVEECCILCQDTATCNYYEYCRTDADTCDSRPGRQYTIVPYNGAYSPGDCLLYSALDPSTYLQVVSDANPLTPWDTGFLAGAVPSSVVPPQSPSPPPSPSPSPTPSPSPSPSPSPPPSPSPSGSGSDGVLDLLSSSASCNDPQLPALAEAAWLEETTGAGITAACPANTVDWKAVCDCLVPIPLWDCPECAKGVIEGQLSAECRSGLAGSQLEVEGLGITYGSIWSGIFDGCSVGY